MSGSLKGRSIVSPKNSSVRPTTDKIRAAIFSSLGDRIIGARVLDGFAGTGSFGIEAVSRGADHVTFVEKKPDLLKKNMELVAGADVCLQRGDFFTVLGRLGRSYDIVFVDPPYGVYPTESICEAVTNNDILALSGIMIYEESVRTPFSTGSAPLVAVTEKRYGDTNVIYLEGAS